MDKEPHIGMKPRKRIALTELQVLVSLLVKFWHNNHGASASDIWKPTWWPSNIRFKYPIQRNRSISPAMWRKDLVAIITNYYYTTRNSREHLNDRNVLNDSDFLWEIQGELFHNNNANAAVIKPKQSNRENSVQLSENTLKRLLPRLEVRLVDIQATEAYRKFRENSQQSRQKQFLRNLSLITVPEYDNMHLDARYTFRASTKLQSDCQQSSSKLQIHEADEETTLEMQNEEPLVQESNQRERSNKEQRNNEKQTSVEEDIVVVNVEPIVVDKTLEKNCLQEKQSDDSSSESSWESSVVMETSDCDLSSSEDLDELSIKARVSLQQCSPAYVRLNKATNERTSRKNLQPRWIKQRVLQPRRARMISRMKISSNYVSTWKKALK